jgi:hypothetical protein
MIGTFRVPVQWMIDFWYSSERIRLLILLTIPVFELGLFIFTLILFVNEAFFFIWQKFAIHDVPIDIFQLLLMMEFNLSHLRL